MASLPKKGFERFSGAIIHKTEIYVYLFMTFTIIFGNGRIMMGCEVGLILPQRVI
jgi:hypothetical protein